MVNFIWFTDDKLLTFTGAAPRNAQNDRTHEAASSGVAGPLATQGGGQICRPFVLGF